jgi:hypothetical protein
MSAANLLAKAGLHRPVFLAMPISVLVLLGFSVLLAPLPAFAAEASGAGYEVFGRFAPTDLRPGHQGVLHLTVFDR